MGELIATSSLHFVSMEPSPDSVMNSPLMTEFPLSTSAPSIPLMKRRLFKLDRVQKKRLDVVTPEPYSDSCCGSPSPKDMITIEPSVFGTESSAPPASPRLFVEEPAQHGMMKEDVAMDTDKLQGEIEGCAYGMANVLDEARKLLHEVVQANTKV